MDTKDQLMDFCFTCPKAELHIHIEGSFEPELMFKIAERNKIQLPYASVNHLKEKYKFKDLQEFLDIYYAGCKVLINEEDFADLAYAYVEKASSQGMKYAEIFFDPQSHCSRGVQFETVLNGLKKGLNKAKANFDFDYGLIMCFLRHLPEEDALKLFNQMLPYKKDILSIGLDSTEIGFPPIKFKNVYEMAKKENIHCVAHAGEEGPAQYIEESIDILGIERIDHGIRIMDDMKLVERVAKAQIPLTLCPLSNLKLQCCPDLTKYKLREMLKVGLLVMLNSDDPSYFGGYIGDNYRAMVEYLNLTKHEIVFLAKNSFIASFLSKEDKQKYIDSIDKSAK